MRAAALSWARGAAHFSHMSRISSAMARSSEGYKTLAPVARERQPRAMQDGAARQDYDEIGPRNVLPAAVFGIAVGALYALGCYLITGYLKPHSGLLLDSFLFGVPLAAPCLTIVVADPKARLRTSAHAVLGAIVITAMIVVGVIALGEGGICVIMAAPLFYLIGIPSAMLTGAILRGVRTRLLSSVLILAPLLGLPVENQADYPAQTETVVSTADIAAPARTVWRNLVEVRDIKPAELGWTFTQDLVGVPKPMDARLDRHGAGAVRFVTWGGGIHFEERIARWDENRVLAWTFHFGPDAVPRAIEGHVKLDSSYLKVLGGDYTLTPLAGGRTRVTLATHYWMRTPVNGYAAWWGRIFVGDFHRNVLTVIRARAEKDARQAAAD
jgi:hypothetical protein